MSDESVEIRLTVFRKKIPNTAAVAIISTILIAFGCWIYFGDTSIRQKRRMKLAGEFLPSIVKTVHAHPEFQDVLVGVGTGAGGCLLVTGMIETEKNLSDLQRIIRTQNPPVVVIYNLKVLEKYSNVKP